MSHSHHGNCDHGDEDDSDMGVRYSLFTQIDLQNVQCLNEAEDGSGKKVFKPWEYKLNSECVESDADAELLFNIPFISNVKLKGIVVIGGSDASHPSKIRLYKNRESMTFDDARCKCDHEFELFQDIDGSVEYPLPPVKFSSVSNLSIHFPTNFGSDQTVIYYIGLRGEYTPFKRHGVTICTYEASALMGDHKIKNFDALPQVM